jgi:hypothetical protein
LESIELLVILEVSGLEDKEVFEKHVVKEGFHTVPQEEFVYTASSSTTTFATKAYILEVFKKGLQKTEFDSCNMVFLLNETPYPPYTYDKTTNDFEEVK